MVGQSLRQPYSPHGVWKIIQFVTADRAAKEQPNTFGTQIAALRADVVIDMICFTEESPRQLVETLLDK